MGLGLGLRSEIEIGLGFGLGLGHFPLQERAGNSRRTTNDKHFRGPRAGSKQKHSREAVSTLLGETKATLALYCAKCMCIIYFVFYV